jgi:FkbM family methyltransferase
MTISDDKKTKGVVSYILELPILRRVKIVKKLVLDKFDLILNKATTIEETLLARSNNLTSQINRLDNKTNVLLENDTPLLQAAIHNTRFLQALQQEITLSLQTDRQDRERNLDIINQSIQQLSEIISEKVDLVQKENHTNYQFLRESVEHLENDTQQRLHLLEESVQRSISSINSVTQDLSRLLNLSENLSQNLSKYLESNNVLNTIVINSKEKIDIEASLMAYLYSYLPNPTAIDIGANVGDISESLLKAGYDVYAFEPFSPTFSKLSDRFANYSNFQAYNFAIGAVNESRELHIAQDKTGKNIYGDSSQYNSLLDHSMPENLIFIDTVPVTVKTLESLHHSLEIPSSISLVKIDTEGFDIEVIRGMGDYRYPVVVTEFWDESIPFGKSKTFNKLQDTVQEMRRKKYLWYIVIYRVWGKETLSFYCNYYSSLEGSWGNVFFFQDYHVFTHALNWCSAMLPITIIKNP